VLGHRMSPARSAAARAPPAARQPAPDLSAAPTARVSAPNRWSAAAFDTLARQIAGKSTLTVAMGKEAFYRHAELDLAAYRYAAEVMTTNMLAQDAGEGIDAFLAKRPPVWQDR
jgi:enoyl-CoA hydratase/carnithine racemase